MPAIVNLQELTKLLLWNRGEGNDDITKQKQHQPQEEEEEEEMLVIGAGCARTGTSSLKAALERLGLKSYHMKYAITKDTNLWYQHALDRLQGKPGIYESHIIPSMAQQGYNATVDKPNCMYYQDLMEQYPNAKVILSLRVEDDIDDKDSTAGGESYAVSALNTVSRVGPLYHRVPYKWFPIVKKLAVIHDWHMAEYDCPLDPKTHFPKYSDLVASYTKWIKNVRETVPTEKLLLFKPTDGWEPLCDFLTTKTTIPESSLLQIKTNCQQVLENGEPYPYVNDTKALQKILNVVHWVAVVVENLPITLVFSLLVWWKIVQIKRQKQEAYLERRQQWMEYDAAKANISVATTVYDDNNGSGSNNTSKNPNPTCMVATTDKEKTT